MIRRLKYGKMLIFDYLFFLEKLEINLFIQLIYIFLLLYIKYYKLYMNKNNLWGLGIGGLGFGGVGGGPHPQNPTPHPPPPKKKK